MRINEIINKGKTATILIIKYADLYIDSVKLLDSARKSTTIEISPEQSTYLADECRRIIKEIDKLSNKPPKFPEHIRSGLIEIYKKLLLNGNANLE
jgi:hypothetical protein